MKHNSLPDPATLRGRWSFTLLRGRVRVLGGLLVLALGGWVPSTQAQGVTYVRELTIPPGIDHVLAQTQSPIDYATVTTEADLSRPEYLFDVRNTIFSIDVSTGIFTLVDYLSGIIKLDEFSRLARRGPDQVKIWSSIRSRAYTYSFSGGTFTPPSPDVLFGEVSSMAFPKKNRQAPPLESDHGRATTLADGAGFTVDTGTGDITPAFDLTSGTDPGQFNNVKYITYAPNGLLYVLDYGNGRVQSLDPANGFAPVAQFPFHPGTTTANMQFAIGRNGVLYLGDGLGGGSAYDTSSGVYLGSFTLPGPTPPDPFIHGINPYLATDGTGHVYVFDHTGIHEYLDSTPAPFANPTVTLVRELTKPAGIDYVLAQTQSPIDWATVATAADLNSRSILVDTQGRLFSFNASTGVLTQLDSLPGGQIKLEPRARLAWRGADDLKIFAPDQFQMFNYSVLASSPYPDAPLVFVTDIHSMAMPKKNRQAPPLESNQGRVTMLAGATGYTFDTGTGDITPAFTLVTGTALGQFNNAKFLSYAPNGLLYVLDFGNRRVQSLDPANGFAPVAQFPLRTGAPVVNMQFAIGPTGTLFLGDDLGGCSAYDTTTGTYLGSFTLTGTTPANPFTSGIAPYITADGLGNVFVFDHTGIHQYLDSSATPDADADNDGSTNLTELRLGLSQTSSAESFRATVAPNAGVGGGYTATWPTQPGLSFKVYRSTELTPGSWTLLATLVGTGTYTDLTPPPSRAFYRVELE